MIELAHAGLIVLQAVWRRRWLAAGVTWGVALIGAAVVAVVPNRYEATARVYVDTQTVLKPLMAGLTFQPDIDQQVRMLARTVVSRPNIDQMLKLPGIAPAAEAPEEHERRIDRLMEKIKVDSSGGNLYIISYRDTDPAYARTIVGGLVNLFVDSGVDSKQRDSQEAGQFIDEQIRTYDGKLREAESRLKDFKIRNFGFTGVSNQDYYTRISLLSDEVGKLKISLAAAEQGRDALRRELSSEDPRLPVEAGGNQWALPQASELDTRIDAQRKQLDELLRRYTDEHPDVVNARRIISQLEAQRRTEQDNRTRLRGSREGGGAAATSPVFQRIRVALAEAEANVASLRSQLSAQEQQLDQARATASKVPQAEAELAQLNRDYDILRKNYDLLVSRREAAALGLKLDKSAQLADFRIIEPPRVAPQPVFPDRRLLAVGAMLAALAAGIASAYGLSLLMPAFHSARALEAYTKRPVLNSVGNYRTSHALQFQRRELLRWGGVMLSFVAVQSAWIIWVSTRILPHP